MRLLITGATGMLGQAVRSTLAPDHTLFTPSRKEMDITDAAAVRRQVEAARPDWVLHLAALTNVDRCEQEPALAYQHNSEATEQLAGVCQEFDAGLLFVSTIAVFDGAAAQPYGESARPDPVNVYGCSKLRAERAVAALPRHVIVRSSWLFGGGVVDKKFVGKILALASTRDRLQVVADKVGSPTSVVDMARGMKRLLEAGEQGVFHVVNDGPPASRHELARAIVNAAGLATRVEPVSSDYFPQLAPRPAMEAARSEKLPAGWLPPWPAALRAYVKEWLERPKLSGYDRQLYERS